METRSTNDYGTGLQGPQQKASTGTADLAIFVQNLLSQMTERFTTMSTSILGRIDELGARIDELEKQIEDMVQQSSSDDQERKGSLLQ